MGVNRPPYWKRAVKRISRDTLASAKGRIAPFLIGIVGISLGFLLNACYLHLQAAKQLATLAFVSLVGSYVIWFLGAWIVNTLRVPWLLDEESGRLINEWESKAQAAEAVVAELRDRVLPTDPRIVPTYERGTGGWASAVTDDKLVLTNHGGGDAFDVQVHEINTGLTTVRFAQVPLIPSKQSGEVVPDLSGIAYGKTIQIPIHDLGAYCEEAAQRGVNRWDCRITYRDFGENWFETRFTLKHSQRYEVQTEGFVFARIAEVPTQ